MNTERIFLASSSHLKEDRAEFETFIYRKNKNLVQKDVFLEIIIWENFLDAMSQTRLQDEYNKAIRGCDIFVMLFSAKVGQYTEEEFETAFGQFKATKKPLIYTYFKDAATSTGSLDREDLKSLWAFQDKLKGLGHFYTVYKNVDDLKFKFDQQLNKIVETGLFTQQMSDLSGNFLDISKRFREYKREDQENLATVIDEITSLLERALHNLSGARVMTVSIPVTLREIAYRINLSKIPFVKKDDIDTLRDVASSIDGLENYFFGMEGPYRADPRKSRGHKAGHQTNIRLFRNLPRYCYGNSVRTI